MIIRSAIICFSVLLLTSTPTFSQPQPGTPEYHIQALQGGFLLVRLKSNRKKIEAIENQLETATGENAEKWAKMLETTEKETQEENQGYIDAFESAYDFSDLAYFYDYDTRAIIDRKVAPWSADLETEVEIDTSEQRYILSFGRTDESKIGGMQILTIDLSTPGRPFPSNISTSGVSAIFASISGKKEKAHVERLNKKLHRYLEKVNAGAGD